MSTISVYHWKLLCGCLSIICVLQLQQQNWSNYNLYRQHRTKNFNIHHQNPFNALKCPPKDDTIRTPSFYASYISAGERLLKAFNKKLEPFLSNALSPWKNQYGIYFWDAFIPTLTCPHYHDRIGAPAGGGKWVCGFNLFENDSSPCVVYSFGVGPDSSFEAEFLTKTNCTIHMFDHTTGAPKEGPGSRLPPGSNHRWTFENIGLGAKNAGGVQTLKQAMQSHGDEWIDFLKIDIEWAEFSAFGEIMDQYEILPFGHLNLEIHLQTTGFDNDADTQEFKEFSRWWDGLLNHGLRAFTWEVNHHPTVITEAKKPFAVEYSFLNIKRNPRLLLLD